MRIIVISDIHGNLDAFNAVLTDIGDFDGIWNLGDVVGYGPEPNECVNKLKSLPGLVSVVGNHDVAALGRINETLFNYEARLSLHWLKKNLTNESKDYLFALKETEIINQATIVHGSPNNPIWEYILETHIAKKNFAYFSTDYCFVGHTHQPIICTLDAETNRFSWEIPDSGTTYPMTKRMILNPGSVGQPRDQDPRASYGIFDTEAETWQVCKVEYDVEVVQQKIKARNLPNRHAQRLTGGW